MTETSDTRPPSGPDEPTGPNGPSRPDGPAVLITGAGPTGLTLAVELARQGVSFRLIEAAAD